MTPDDIRKLRGDKKKAKYLSRIIRRVVKTGHPTQSGSVRDRLIT